MENLYQIISITLYVLIVSGFDSYFYGRGEKGYYKWLFKPFNWFGREVPIRYRVLQKILETTGLALVLVVTDIYCVIACLICHYFMLLDRLYYIFNGQENGLKEAERTNANMYWLKPIYFSGYFFFKDKFTVLKFNISAIIGILISIIIIILL
jgi:hypothetical protein